jgi:predicted nuclease of predicted toxin-antitoxin system
VRFLIDECLHTTLVEVANLAGHEAHHVNYLGLSSTTDHDLMRRIVSGDFIFVTNNAVDFRRLYRAQDNHAGLIILVPQVPPRLQRALFMAAIKEIDEHEGAMNQAIEVLIDREDIVINRYEWPTPSLP